MPPNLFEFAEEHSAAGMANKPLAHRMRPRSLDEFVGQSRILAPGKPLRQWIEADRVPSLLFWGPPGCGKTTLAQIIAHQTQSHFEALSAVHSGVREIKEAVLRAKSAGTMARQKTILFIDEIHRFNKSQQDALLPHVEDGTVTLIGATTENPSFEINSALLSRVRVIHLDKLSTADVTQALQRALQDPLRGFGGRCKFSAEAVEWLAKCADGDARRALTALDSVASFFDREGIFSEMNTEQVQAALESVLERQPIVYDKSGEEHYNIISAFIKSLRASDPQAGLYYLARMLEGGEDALFIVRRMVIFASEDIGNADPRALTVALAVKDAVEFVGLPEGRINLAQAVTYLAMAPKSNASYLGIEAAIAEVRESGTLPVPMHLRNAVTSHMKAEGYGKNYVYPHNVPQARVEQSNLPVELVGKKYYEPKDSGLERQYKERLGQRLVD